MAVEIDNRKALGMVMIEPSRRIRLQKKIFGNELLSKHQPHSTQHSLRNQSKSGRLR
jgi:hypothetical protein